MGVHLKTLGHLLQKGRQAEDDPQLLRDHLFVRHGGQLTAELTLPELLQQHAMEHKQPLPGRGEHRNRRQGYGAGLSRGGQR